MSEIPDIFQKWAKNILRQHENTPHLALMMAAGMNNAFELGKKEEREQFGLAVIEAAKEISLRRAKEPVFRPAPGLGELIRHEMNQPIRLGLVAMMGCNHHAAELVNEELAGLLVDDDARFIAIPLGKGEHHSHVDRAVVVAGKDDDADGPVLCQRAFDRAAKCGDANVQSSEHASVNVQYML